MQLKKTDKTNYLIIVVLLVLSILKLSIINYGLPMQFHPDETTIYKEPFKILYNYFHFRFTPATNLYNWFIPIWYGLLFLGGRIFGTFNSFNDFNQALIAEDSIILLWGRLLSFILSFIGTIYIWKTVSRNKNIPSLWQIVIFATIIFNPIEYISNLWIKFDAVAYAFSSFAIYRITKYFEVKNLDKKESRKLYIILFLGTTIRIDLVAFLISFLIIDFQKNYHFSIKLFLLEKYKLLITGIILYCLITFVPIKIIYEFFDKSKTEIFTGNSLDQETYSRTIGRIISGLDISSLLSNLSYFFVIGILAIGFPLIHSTYLLKKENRFLLIAASIILFPLLLLSQTPHYFLILSLIILITYSKSIFIFKNKIFTKIYLWFNFIYVMSITIQICYSICFETDTRIISKDYILTNTKQTDVLAIEDFLNPGQYPSIDECPDILLKKAEITKKYKLGTGKTLEAQAQKSDSKNCRVIIGVSQNKPYLGTEYDNIWSIQKDIEMLNKLKPNYFISLYNYYSPNGDDTFAIGIKKYFSTPKIFEYTFIDDRINGFIFKENFFPKFYFYKSLN